MIEGAPEGISEEYIEALEEVATLNFADYPSSEVATLEAARGFVKLQRIRETSSTTQRELERVEDILATLSARKIAASEPPEQ